MNSNEDRLRALVRDLMANQVPLPTWEIGDVVMHPGGDPVRILDGRLWVTYPDGSQRLANEWVWIKVDAFGNEVGEPESGPGWVNDPAVAAPSLGH